MNHQHLNHQVYLRSVTSFEKLPPKKNSMRLVSGMTAQGLGAMEKMGKKREVQRWRLEYRSPEDREATPWQVQ